MGQSDQRAGTLPEDEENRPAAAQLLFARDRPHYTLSPDQIEGVQHAMATPSREKPSVTSGYERFSVARYEHPRHGGRGRWA